MTLYRITYAGGESARFIEADTAEAARAEAARLDSHSHSNAGSIIASVEPDTVGGALAWLGQER